MLDLVWQAEDIMEEQGILIAGYPFVQMGLIGQGFEETDPVFVGYHLFADAGNEHILAGGIIDRRNE